MVYISEQAQYIREDFLHIIFCISAFLNLVSLFCLIKQTPPNQAKIRNFLLFMQVGCFYPLFRTLIKIGGFIWDHGHYDRNLHRFSDEADSALSGNRWYLHWNSVHDYSTTNRYGILFNPFCLSDIFRVTQKYFRVIIVSVFSGHPNLALCLVGSGNRLLHIFPSSNAAVWQRKVEQSKSGLNLCSSLMCRTCNWNIAMSCSVGKSIAGLFGAIHPSRARVCVRIVAIRWHTRWRTND